MSIQTSGRGSHTHGESPVAASAFMPANARPLQLAVRPADVVHTVALCQYGPQLAQTTPRDAITRQTGDRAPMRSDHGLYNQSGCRISTRTPDGARLTDRYRERTPILRRADLVEVSRQRSALYETCGDGLEGVGLLRRNNANRPRRVLTADMAPRRGESGLRSRRRAQRVPTRSMCSE